MKFCDEKKPCVRCGEPSGRVFEVSPLLCTFCVVQEMNRKKQANRGRVYCSVERQRDEDRTPIVAVTCTRCGHSEESYGWGSKSLKRCRILLEKNCLRGERNTYRIRELEDESRAYFDAAPSGGPEF
jgi:hypothetical protein